MEQDEVMRGIVIKSALLLATASLALVGCVSRAGGDLPPDAVRASVVAAPTAGDLIDGQAWNMAGATVVHGNLANTDSLHIASTSLAIVNQDGSPNQINPPINLYGTRLNVSGNFEITAELSNVTSEIGINLYGTPPIVEDEYRAEVATLATTIENTSATASVSEQPDGNTVSETTGTIAASPTHTIVIKDVGGEISMSVDNQIVGKAISDEGIFSTGHVWLGIDARTPSSQFDVTKLTAGPLSGGTVARVNTQTQTIASDPSGFAALADVKQPGFLFGAAVALGPEVSDSQYDKLLGNYNSITTENVGKMQFIHPLEGNAASDYNFADMDAVVAIAQKSHIEVHGHALVFGEANPAWVQNIAKSDPSALQAVMVSDIQTIVGHYKNNVQDWDVVNEPLADSGTTPGQLGLRQNIWYQAMGPDYIATALRTTHAANPNAQLWINEFGMESDDDRFAQMVILIKHLQAEGVPLTGIGFQSHIDSGDTIDSNDDQIDTATLASRFKVLAALGLKARISELDITNPSEMPVFGQVVRACIAAYPTCVDVTTWGLTDAYSSSGSLDPNGAYSTGTGLPWDSSLQPTAAVSDIKKSLQP